MKDAMRAEKHMVLSNKNRNLGLRKMDCTAFTVVAVRARLDCQDIDMRRMYGDRSDPRVDNGSIGRQ